MYKILNIGGEEYKLEFSIEASLRSECIEKITEIMVVMSSVNEDSAENRGDVLKGLSNIPNTALECFYSGLLEHHGYDGDGRVKSINDAKRLVITLFSDADESGYKNWNDILALCVDQMAEDGFFELIGLVDKPKEPKSPQDHKRKVRKVSEN